MVWIISNYLKLLGIRDRMSNLLEQHNTLYCIFLVLGIDISNLLEML